jgi:hypothetical protein
LGVASLELSDFDSQRWGGGFDEPNSCWELGDVASDRDEDHEDNMNASLAIESECRWPVTVVLLTEVREVERERFLRGEAQQRATGEALP